MASAEPMQFDELPDALPQAAPAARTGASAAATAAALSIVDKLGDGSTTQATSGDGGANLIAQFTQVWITEKAAPDLLFHETAMVDALKGGVEERQEKLNAMSSAADMTFLCSILQMEVNRVNFLLHSYHRCRLQKIEKYATYIITEKREDRCSPAELNFLMGYAELLNSHFKSSFLDGLPDKLATWFSMDTPADDPLIVKPDTKNKFVTFRVKTDDVTDYAIADGQDEVSFHQGDIVVGNWKDFEALFRDDKIDLL
jgi:GINS complex subunit 4